jgi:hypothetical protein
MRSFILLATFFLGLFSSMYAQTIDGIVFLDQNQNLLRDPGEQGLQDVLVSNGRDVVKTDASGKWSLSANEDLLIFVIQPSGYRVPVNDSMIPQHYFVNNGSQKNAQFPIWKDESSSNEFKALFYGDTQARGLREVNFVMHDVVEECIGTQAKFGVALGDIVADDPELFDEISAGIGQIGIPWYYVFGNHDHDAGVKGNDGADATFVRNFGPATYAYEYGKVAFISLNNVFYKEEGGYKAHFTDDQIQFVEQYLSFLPQDFLVVLMMHIPIVACDNREQMFRILEKRQHTLSVAGHTHELANVFVDEKFGWQGEAPHHMFINGTVSGSWWCGIQDEVGIPHATMNDGAPNGYAIIKFSGNTYNIQYKAARRTVDYQMNIYVPDDVSQDALDTTAVLVNVFNGSEKSDVEMRVDHSGKWIALGQTTARDPANMKLFDRGKYLNAEVENKSLDNVFGWKMDFPSKSDHFWKGNLPEGLGIGTHRITIRTTDMFGNTYQSHRIFRVGP